MKKLIFILLILMAGNANAATYWASVSGGAASCAAASGTSDPGTYRTLTQGLACLAAGDTLILKSGTYTTRLTDNTPSGVSDSQHTTVRSETALGAVFQPGTGGSIWVMSAARSYITIDGIDFNGVNCQSEANGDCGGFAISNTTNGAFHHIKIQNNRFRNIGSDGITTSGVDQIQILNNVFNTVGTNNAGLSHGIYIAGSADSNFSTGVTISGNHLTTCGGYCIHLYTPVNHREVIVTKNFAKTCGTLVGQSCYVVYANDAAIGYNIAVNANSGAEAAGFVLRQGTRQLYYNNIVYNSTNGIYADFNNNISATCKNNIVISVTGETIRNCGDGTATNITSGSASTYWVNAASDNFNLVSTATLAINQGTTAIGTIIIGGISINVTAPFNGSARDIGPFETWGLTNCNVGDVAANKLRCNVENNAAPPVLAPSATGWTALESGGNKAIASVAVVGTSIIEFTTSANYSSGTTCDVQYATTGSASDSSLIGASLNQRLNAVSSVTCTNTVSGGGTSPVFTQTHARVRNLYGAEVAVAVDWKAAEDTAYTIIPGGAARIRIKSKVTTADPAAYNPTIQYDFNDNNWVAWTDTCSASVLVCAVGTALSIGVSNGAATTEQLTSDLATNIGCAVVLTSGAVPSLDPGQDSEWECEYGIRVHSSIAVGTVIRFRQIKDGATPYDTYSVYPTLTVANPGLTQF